MAAPKPKPDFITPLAYSAYPYAEGVATYPASISTHKNTVVHSALPAVSTYSDIPSVSTYTAVPAVSAYPSYHGVPAVSTFPAVSAVSAYSTPLVKTVGYTSGFPVSYSGLHHF